MEQIRVASIIEGKQTLITLSENEFLSKRKICISGEINDELALEVKRQMLYLDACSHDDIDLEIFSLGGWTAAGWVIYDTMHYLIKSKVNTIGMGMAASMGAFLLATGTGRRTATKNCDILLHQPLGGVSGQASDISIVAAHIQKEKHKLASTLASVCKKPVLKLLKVMDRDAHFSTAEAVSYGLLTGIYENTEV